MYVFIKKKQDKERYYNICMSSLRSNKIKGDIIMYVFIKKKQDKKRYYIKAWKLILSRRGYLQRKRTGAEYCDKILNLPTDLERIKINICPNCKEYF